MEEPDDSFVPVPMPDLVKADLDGETVILDETSGRLHVLSPTAAITWDCFDGAATVGEIVADLSDVFGVDPTAVRNDVVVLVGELIRSGLLETEPSSAPPAAGHGSASTSAAMPPQPSNP